VRTNHWKKHTKPNAGSCIAFSSLALVGLERTGCLPLQTLGYNTFPCSLSGRVQRLCPLGKMAEVGEHLSLFSGNALITALISWSLLVFGICMLLFMLLTPQEMFYVLGVKQIPTLSLSGAYQPMEAIFTLGLHWLSVMSAILFFLIWQKNKRHIRKLQSLEPPPFTRLMVCCCFACPLEGPQLDRVNTVLLGLGLGFSFFMALVGAIPLSLNELGHGTVAILMFILGVFHVVLHFHSLRQLYAHLPQEDGKGREVDSQRHQQVSALAYFLVLPLNILIIVIVFITFVSCSSLECRDFVVQMLVVLEFTTAIGLIVYVESNRGMDFSVTIVQLFFRGHEQLQLQLQEQGQEQEAGQGQGQGQGQEAEVELPKVESTAEEKEGVEAAARV